MLIMDSTALENGLLLILVAALFEFVYRSKHHEKWCWWFHHKVHMLRHVSQIKTQCVKCVVYW